VDKDAAWALKPDDIADESDDVYSLCDDDDDGTLTNDVDPPEADEFSPTLAGNQALPELGSLRDRKSSIPLGGRALASPQMTTTPSLDGFDMPLKQVCRDLVKVAQELNTYDSEEVAQEITRMEAKMFMEIEVYLRCLLVYSLPAEYVTFAAQKLASILSRFWEKGP
jgi:hypothetical protein